MLTACCSAVLGGCCFLEPNRGWVFSYSTADLSLQGAWTPLPGCEAGIWHAGAGVAVDTAGDGGLYVALGNGLLPNPTYGGGFSNGIVKLSSGSLRVVDYFLPYNNAGKQSPWTQPYVTQMIWERCTQ